MKKYIGLLILCALSMGAQAGSQITWNQAGCEAAGGVWIQAHKASDDGCDADHCNEMTFCQSSVRLNWWSAFAWCESIGAKLVDLEHACPNGLSNNFFCANLNGRISDNVFTNVPCDYAGRGQIYCVGTNGSMTHGSGGRTTDPYYCALCEPKSSQ